MNDNDNEIAKSNTKYEHFPLFKKAIETYPSRTLDMIIKHGSAELKASPYIQTCSNLHAMSIINSFFKLTIGSTAAIYLATFLLHRQRALVLTAPGGLRSILTKYLPIWFCYGFYQFYYSVKVPTDKVNEDFGEIQAQFWSMYSLHGDLLRQGLAAVDK